MQSVQQLNMTSHPTYERAFLNTLSDEVPDSLRKHNSNERWEQVPDWTKYKEKGEQYFEVVMEAHSDGRIDFSDTSVYTGITGTALLLFKRYLLTNDKDYLHSALNLLHPCLSRLKGRAKDCTFLCGDCGPLAVCAVICHHLGATHQKLRDECLEKILLMEGDVVKSTSLPNEMLYGRAGYLYTLLYLQHWLGESFVRAESIINIANAIVTSGMALSRRLRSDCPLMYEWYDEFYTGAAHGFAGILYFHIKVADKYPQVTYDSIVRSTVDYMMTLKFPSGNYPSSLESSETDKLVHWCHGAPGFVYLFAAAYQRYKDLKYKCAALECADVVWQRGLLKKGYGICHGTAGNAYSLLCAYKISGELKYLARALQFANWCLDYGKHGCRTPDRPYSMFEGMAGTAYFLLDIVHPNNAAFPAFEI